MWGRRTTGCSSDSGRAQRSSVIASPTRASTMRRAAAAKREELEGPRTKGHGERWERPGVGPLIPAANRLVPQHPKGQAAPARCLLRGVEQGTGGGMLAGEPQQQPRAPSRTETPVQRVESRVQRVIDHDRGDGRRESELRGQHRDLGFLARVGQADPLAVRAQVVEDSRRRVEVGRGVDGRVALRVASYSESPGHERIQIGTQPLAPLGLERRGIDPGLRGAGAEHRGD